MRIPLYLLGSLLPAAVPAQILMNNFDGNNGWEELPIVIDTAANNLWQVGDPDKTVFTDAYSPVNVIVTDTAAPCPPGNQSRFTVLLPSDPWGWWPEFFLHFRQQVHTDEQHSGGYIEISYDTGQTWMNVFDDWMNPPNIELIDEVLGVIAPDTLSNGHLGFTGEGPAGANWIWSSFCWVQTGIPLPDTLRLRFTFYTDSAATPGDGWMLDDFEYMVYMAHPISEFMRKDHYFETAPNPVTDRLFVSFDTDAPTTPVRIELRDAQARLMRVLLDDELHAGRHSLMIDRDELPAQTQVCYLHATIGDRSCTERILIAP